MKKIIIPVLVIFSLMITTLYSCKSNNDKLNTKDTVSSKNTAKDSIVTKKDEDVTKKETAPEGKTVSLNTDEQKKINIFFSNFSEVNLKPFAAGKISDEELINFGVMHSYINNRKSFEKADAGNVKIKEDNITKAIQKYFGLKFSGHKSANEIKYKNGYYIIPEADGEAYTFSQVEKLNDIGNDRYVAFVNVYTASSGWTGNPHASPKEWKNKDEAPESTGKFKATVSKANGPNGDVYTLIDYIKQ